MVEQMRSMGWWPSLYEPFYNAGARIAEWFSPPSEATSDDDAYIVKVELPGVDLKDVDLSVSDGVVSLKGEKRSSREESGATWHFSERSYGAFARSFRLPADADAERLDADMRDGVLTITAPKIAAKTPKAVEIRSG